jgi:Family of unknown function (DUF6325)
LARPDTTRDTTSAPEITEMGPIDYMVLEWPHGLTPADVAPMLVDLHDSGIIRILDVAFLAKDDDGTVTAVEGAPGAFAVFEDASSGLLGPDDLEDAGTVLEPGTAAAVLVWENRWAAPVAAALRRSGAQLAASGRIPVQAILASLEATENES